MGGDFGPSVIVPACLSALKKHPMLNIILVGNEDILQKYLSSRRVDMSRIAIKHASETVNMDELPSVALRTKKDSSMRVAINLVKEGKAGACVSAGNTGALMATARFVLKTLPGIDRPAITATLPTMKPEKTVRMLDLGANVDSSADYLFQFAVMGSVAAEAVDHLATPKVGLLNIGEEEIKGNEQVKATAALLTDNSDLNYIGYVEGDDIYKCVVDVVVCDGFVGNVALKSSEGTAQLIAYYIKKSFNKNILTRAIGFIALPILRAIKKRIDPARYNGASLVGLRGIVVKSHGHAGRQAFARAIDEAVIQIEQNIPQLIKNKLERYLEV